MDGILTYLWEHREEFYPPMPKIDQALEKIRHMAKPVILVDYGDVPNAGGTGDGSVVLEALLKADLPETSVVVVADQESTDLAERSASAVRVCSTSAASASPASSTSASR